MENKKVKAEEKKLEKELVEKANQESLMMEIRDEDHHLSPIGNSGTIFLDENGALYTLENDIAGITGIRKLIRHNKGKDLVNVQYY